MTDDLFIFLLFFFFFFLKRYGDLDLRYCISRTYDKRK